MQALAAAAGYGQESLGLWAMPAMRFADVAPPCRCGGRRAISRHAGPRHSWRAGTGAARPWFDGRVGAAGMGWSRRDPV